jgi:hypothetical protein
MSIIPKPPEILDKIVDIVLAHKPKLKKAASSPKSSKNSEDKKHKTNKKATKGR